MSKPKFDPSKPFKTVTVQAKTKPAFDPGKPFEAVNTADGPNSMAQTVSRFARPALELGGALGGGALAAPGGPAAMAGGGVLGFAGGKAAADLLDRKLGIKPEISSLGEVARETVQNIGEGAVSEMTGQVAGNVAMRAAGPLAKLTAPAVKGMAEKAKKFAVDLTPATIRKSKGFALIENAFRNNPFSGSIMHKLDAKVGQQLEEAASSLADDLATIGAKEAAGTAASADIQGKMFKRLEVRDKLFDRLTKAVPKDTMIGTDSLKESAEALLLKESQLPQADQNQSIITYLKDKVRSPQVGLSFDGAKALRERLRAQIGPIADTPEKQVYKQLKGALDQDLAAFAEKSGGNIEKAWKKANAFHGSVKQLADDPNIRSIVEKANPGAVVDSLLRSKNTLQMRLLRKAMPESGYQKLQGSLVDRLFEGGANQTSSEALVSNLKRYGDEFLEVAISKPKLARLKEFAEVVEATKFVEKVAGNPSGTARNVITQDGFTFLVTNPVKGTINAIAGPTMAKIYFSDFGKGLIQEGVKLSPQAARAAGVAGAILSLSKKDGNRSDSKPQSFAPKTQESSAATKMPVLSPVPRDTPDKAAYRVGVESFGSGDLSEAKAAFQKALKLNPKLLEAQRGLERLAILKERDRSGRK